MSRFYVTEYERDPDEYYHDEPDLGQVVSEHDFRDGEELLAAQFVIGLMEEGRQFDVRREVN